MMSLRHDSAAAVLSERLFSEQILNQKVDLALSVHFRSLSLAGRSVQRGKARHIMLAISIFC